jgi:hypothetical protein
VGTAIRTGDDIELTRVELADGTTRLFVLRVRVIRALRFLVWSPVQSLPWGAGGDLALGGMAASLVAIVWFAPPSLIAEHAIAVAMVTTGAVAFLDRLPRARGEPGDRRRPHLDVR